MHKEGAYSLRAYNWLHDFLFCSQVIPLRFDFLVGFTLLRGHHTALMLPLSALRSQDSPKAARSLTSHSRSVTPDAIAESCETSGGP